VEEEKNASSKIGSALSLRVQNQQTIEMTALEKQHLAREKIQVYFMN
jgi:hypothetical protein